jgi:4a-hydroxytetrahydrobiopterin dehydratase
MSILSQIACTPCRSGEPPLTDEELSELHPMVPAWKVVRDGGIRKLSNTFIFEEPHQVEDFQARVRQLAERENHHPELAVDGGRIRVTWWTRSLGDLHPNDFIMAGKTDGVFTLVMVGQEGDMMTDEALPTLAEVPRFRSIFRHRAEAPEERPARS